MKTQHFDILTFTDEAGGTRVRVDADVFVGYEAFMADTWPKALSRLKALCEGEPR